MALLAFPLSAQNTLTPEWDVRKNLGALTEGVKKLVPLLEAIRPADWAEKGAPGAYVQQHQSAHAAMAHLAKSTGELVQTPERLTVALDVLFRMQSMETLLGSLRDGARKYQDSALADRLTAAMADYSNAKDSLKQHVVDLAAVKESEFQIADQEAQRCRGELTRQPPPSPPARRSRQRESK